MILLLSALLLAADTRADAERTGWQFKRSVVVNGSESLASLALPPDLSTKAAPFGRDLRLVDDSGREVPYLIDWTNAGEGLATWQVGIKEIRREKEAATPSSAVRSQWTLDLGAARSFTDLDLRIPDVAFAWHVQVESSMDGSTYTVVTSDAALFDQVWNNERVRQTALRFATPVTARYVRISARSASGSRTLEIEGASVTLRRRFKDDAWSMEIPVAPAPAFLEDRATSVTRYRVNASSLLPFDEVELICDDPAFSRRVRLIELSGGSTREPDTRLGEGRVFRLRASDSILAGESLRMPVRSGNGGALLLEIDDAGSPPLRHLKVRLHGSRIRLVFPSSGQSVSLYYGNATTREPSYDIEGLRPRLRQLVDAALATLGPEEANPLFKREPPLRFAAVLGASLDPSKWRHERAVAPITAEDVYALTLRAADLAALRPDLADLRVVNAQNLQVPFLLDTDFAAESVTMKVRREATAPEHRSRYRFEPEFTPGESTTPQISRIEVEVADAFFERPARLLDASRRSERDMPFFLTLARRPPASEPLILDTLAPLAALTLEVDDGDNAPLDIRSAKATVRVPRIVFKAAPGRVRLLLGNREATPPRYDIAGLRSELLAYSAVPAKAEALTESGGAEASPLATVTRLPTSAVVWGAILIAIVALVALTLRTLRNG